MTDFNVFNAYLSRRSLLGGALVGGSALLAGCTEAYSETPSPLTQATPTPTSPPFPAPYVQLFPNTELNFEALFGLGSAGVSSEMGEVLTAVREANVNGADAAAYYTAFRSLADNLAASAQGMRPVTARARHLRAAKYYSQALFVVLGSSTPQAEEEVWRKMTQEWTAAAALTNPVWEKIAIPYEGTDLPGWFFSPPGATGAARPTVIVSNGSDGQNIDLLAYGIEAALKRGYNALTYDGPGQGETLFVRGVPFRHDWEKVVTPVVDYLLTRPDVDPSRIALTGWSMSGSLVARAAAYETRLAAVVSDSGLHSAWLAFPEDLRELAQAGDRATVNNIWAQEVIPNVGPFEAYYLAKRFSIFTAEAQRQARAGQVPTDFFAISRAIQALDLNADVMGRVTVPYLVTDYQDDDFYEGQARTLFDGIRGPKTFHQFTDGARYHCGPMAPTLRNEVIFDWLDNTLGL